MIRKFRKIIFIIFSKLIPEIKILKKNYHWDFLKLTLENSHLGKNVRIYSKHYIINSYIDDYTYISNNASISYARIGKYCSIGPNFFCGWGIHPLHGISTSPMFYSTLKQNGITLSKEDKIEERKEIRIGNDVFIGANVIVLDGITIGDGAVIGAGAVVSKNIPPYAIAVGSPIRIIKYRFNDEQIEKLLKIRWWEFDEEKILDIEKMFFDPDLFIRKYEF
jgi:acetyltransferase-like isoleucine patch superfamily enzyme